MSEASRAGVARILWLALFSVLVLVGSMERVRLLGVVSRGSPSPLPDAVPPVPAPPLFQPPEWLDDEGPLDPAAERERCRRHGYSYDDGRTVRRRLFFGSLLADDSDVLLRAFAAESRNVYHAVAYVEGAETGGGFNRTLKYAPGSAAVRGLAERQGPRTAVSVHQIPPGWLGRDMAGRDGAGFSVHRLGIERENRMRQIILRRWAELGMRPDDVGVLGDADEVFTRDFLRAAQICDVPEFRPGQDCRAPKVLAKGLIFEASPECVVEGKLLWHPDMVLGECLEHVGDEELHPPPKRDGGKRAPGHGGGGDGDYAEYLATVAAGDGDAPMYPLWSAMDVRSQAGGGQHRSLINGTRRNLHTAYHLHNFFGSLEVLRFKYRTYAEKLEGAEDRPLAGMHDDLSLAVSCVRGEQNPGTVRRVMGGYGAIQGPRPILFERDQRLRARRHEEVRRMVLEDERVHGAVRARCDSVRCEILGEYQHGTNATGAGQQEKMAGNSLGLGGKK